MCYNGTFRFKKLDDSFWNGETFRFADYIFFARATCFNTTEMTDLTDFVSIACSLRYWLVAADRYLTT